MISNAGFFFTLGQAESNAKANLLMEDLGKLKADDRFFNETGIEEEDVEPNLKRLNLEEDEEFKAICAEWQKKSEDFLASKKDETAALLQKAEAAKKVLAAQKAKADADKAAKLKDIADQAAKTKADGSGDEAEDDDDA